MIVNFELVKKIKSWIKEYFDNNSNSQVGPKAIIGISGGKDSAVCAKLLCDTIGPENVTCVLMMSEETKKDMDYAIEFVTSYLKANIVLIDPKYISELKKLFKMTIDDNLSEQASINITPRIRMTILYMLASTLHARVCGTGNLSERTVGYFTKWGDGACDFNPIGNLTCTEVLEIGNILEIPSYIMNRQPEDGVSGKTDEENMGFSYKELDDYIRKTNFASFNYPKILIMEKANRHKNNPIPMFEIN
ncbi:MAG: NAD(+) synthase [Candidatus Nanoarchaeia archaeon]|nr:NAD(+) synthase [Candidatus Nanoarchaeia archaeon]